MSYDVVENYAMKCRLYPTEAQKRAIDNSIDAVRVFHNCLVYDMWNNKVNLREEKSKNDKLETVHYPDLKTALKAEYKNKLVTQHPCIKDCPAAALTTNVGLKEDLEKEFGKKPIEFQKPKYYNEQHPRRSYSYQEPLSKIQVSENRNVFRFNLTLIGSVKVRGWNQKLRFGDEETNFLAWAIKNPKEKVTVVVCKDSVGDYFIVFKIKECLKPFGQRSEKKTGVDVGIKDIAISSESGKKYENKTFKKKEKRHQRKLNRKLSRQWGPSNEKYRDEQKKNRVERKKYLNNPELCEAAIPPPICPSKRYLRTRNQHARLNRKISRKRDNWNHEISRELVESYGTIAVETLNIKGMFRNKHLSYALSDAAFGTLLQYIRYKSAWHERNVVEIGVWTPSSKRCSTCGYIYTNKDQYHLKPWSLNIREWTCPVCSTKHDRDVNAAKNILYYAEEKLSQQKA